MVPSSRNRVRQRISTTVPNRWCYSRNRGGTCTCMVCGLRHRLHRQENSVQNNPDACWCDDYHTTPPARTWMLEVKVPARPCRHVQISIDKFTKYRKCHTAVISQSLHGWPVPELACSDTDANCCNLAVDDILERLLVLPVGDMKAGRSISKIDGWCAKVHEGTRRHASRRRAILQMTRTR